MHKNDCAYILAYSKGGKKKAKIYTYFESKMQRKEFLFKLLSNIEKKKKYS